MNQFISGSLVHFSFFFSGKGRMVLYSRLGPYQLFLPTGWALTIRGWALNGINTVIPNPMPFVCELPRPPRCHDFLFGTLPRV